MRNDEGHQVYFKASEIFREFFGDRRCNIPDVQDRIAKAVAEGTSKKRFLKRGLEIGFHMTDWHEDARFLIALSLFPERFTNAEIRQGVIWFLNHAGYHVPEAERLIMYPSRSHFRDKIRDKKKGRKKKQGRKGNAP